VGMSALDRVGVGKRKRKEGALLTTASTSPIGMMGDVSLGVVGGGKMDYGGHINQRAGEDD
jgi:hypothetical protein